MACWRAGLHTEFIVVDQALHRVVGRPLIVEQTDGLNKEVTGSWDELWCAVQATNGMTVASDPRGWQGDVWTLVPEHVRVPRSRGPWAVTWVNYLFTDKEPRGRLFRQSLP